MAAHVRSRPLRQRRLASELGVTRRVTSPAPSGWTAPTGSPPNGHPTPALPGHARPAHDRPPSEKPRAVPENDDQAALPLALKPKRNEQSRRRGRQTPHWGHRGLMWRPRTSMSASSSVAHFTWGLRFSVSLTPRPMRSRRRRCFCRAPTRTRPRWICFSTLPTTQLPVVATASGSTPACSRCSPEPVGCSRRARCVFPCSAPGGRRSRWARRLWLPFAN
jgi:hypothetical protein